MRATTAQRIGAATVFIGVALGAFGAHALKDLLAELETTAIWKTAVLYHLIHGAVLFLLPGNGSLPWSRVSGVAWGCLLIGVVLFSGSLYGLAVGGPRWLGPITPLGGLLFLGGWGILSFRKIRGDQNINH